MKRLNILILAACVFLRVGSARAASDSIRLINPDAPRASSSSGLVDIFQARVGGGRLLSLFGYNNGGTGFVELFDTTNGPTINITGFNNSTGIFTNSNGGVATGDAIQLTNTVAGLAAGIYWANASSTVSNGFILATNRAQAISNNAVAISGATATATFNRVPFHTFTVAPSDNYSLIVPNTGIPYGRGLLICTSTTAGTWTAGGTNITVCATISGP